MICKCGNITLYPNQKHPENKSYDGELSSYISIYISINTRTPQLFDRNDYLNTLYSSYMVFKVAIHSFILMLKRKKFASRIINLQAHSSYELNTIHHVSKHDTVFSYI